MDRTSLLPYHSRSHEEGRLGPRLNPPPCDPVWVKQTPRQPNKLFRNNNAGEMSRISAHIRGRRAVSLFREPGG